MFKQIIGQDRVIRLLRRTITNHKVAQAYLFYGPDGVGKLTTALYYGMALNCHAVIDKRPCGVCPSCHKFLELEHPDLIYLFPTPVINFTKDGEVIEKKAYDEYLTYLESRKQTPWRKHYFSTNAEIRIEMVRTMEQRLELTIHEAQYRLCLIEDADQMNDNSYSAFLKTLEEPPPNTVIILTTSNLNRVLPTIVSRCQPICFGAISADLIARHLTSRFQVEPVLAKSLSRICNGNLELAIRLSEQNEDEARVQLFNIIEYILKGDDAGYIAFLTQNRARLKADYISDILSHLIIMLNDLAIYPFTPKLITNVDKEDSLGRCLQSNPSLPSRVDAAIVVMDDLKQKLDGHVNVLVVLDYLYFYLKELFQIAA